jgi:cobalt/nickel transport system ATP-binding protein
MVVTVKNLSYRYPDGTLGLENINVSLEKGKKIAILGVNGSGKSTLLYHLNGTFLAQQGEVKVLDEIVMKKNLYSIRKKVGFLFDYPDHQLFATTVARDVAFGPRNYGFSEKDVEREVTEVLGKVSITELREKPPYQLSLGQKKRTAIAGILIMKPELIVCDEIFSGLDRYAEDELKAVLDELISEGKSLVFSTHDIDMIYGWANQVVLMAEGKIIAIGSTEEILGNKKIMQKANLKMPILAEIFSESEIKPKTACDALLFIKNLIKK